MEAQTSEAHLVPVDTENATGLVTNEPEPSPASGDENQNPLPTKKLNSGCLTCRVRRKNCGEHERHPDAPHLCRICLRLGLPCLGWSAKRPEWTHDKDAVDMFKSYIGEKLNPDIHVLVGQTDFFPQPL
ncbi:hypothetical protein B0H12DRAFT_1118040 [Mycena haematopus]|nr:hypothetical protein B0H12DRAFT_1118040 [Mycena haematopus]